MTSIFELWLTPTISLSLVIESERTSPSFLRFVSRFALLYFQPSLTRSSLEYELATRGSGREGISAATLRVVDAAYYRTVLAQGIEARSTPIYPEELVVSLAAVEGIAQEEETYKLLEASLERVLATYEVVDEAIERTETPFEDDEAGSAQLRELWTLLKPEQELSGLVSKQWQELGFQGTSPKTDTRRLGSLAIDALLHFARTYGHRAVEIVDEAVNGGVHWYPLALASIHMTAFALDLATSRDLQLFLLRSYQARPDAVGSSKADTTPLLAVASELLVLFHAHWLRGGYTVMQFEQVAKEFQEALRPWVRRGVLDGRALGWQTGDRLKLE